MSSRGSSSKLHISRDIPVDKRSDEQYFASPKQISNDYIPFQQPQAQSSRITSHPAQIPHATTAGGRGENGQEIFGTHQDLTQPNLSDTDPMSYSLHYTSYDGESTLQDVSFEPLLTPGYSSENQVSEHTTPQEHIWEQQFLSQDTTQPHILDSSGPHGPDTSDDPKALSGDLQSLFSSIDQEPSKFVSAHQLISPRLTKTPSPSGSQSRSGNPSSSPKEPSDPMAPSLGRKRQLESLNVKSLGRNHSSDVSENADAANHNLWHPSTTRAISPVVMISSYKRGDSPARPNFPLNRSSSKRSHGGDQQRTTSGDHNKTTQLESDTNGNDDSFSRLMPPDSYENDTSSFQQPERSGLDPNRRDADQVATVNELAEQRERDEKNAEVENWLATSETGSDAGSVSPGHVTPRQRTRINRIRSHSSGVQVDALGLRVFSDKHIPGPGVLLDENIADDYTDDASINSAQSVGSDSLPGTPPVPVNAIAAKGDEETPFPSYEEIPPEQQEPLPRQFYWKAPWQDPAQATDVGYTRDQPATSNAAATRWNQEASRWETASRAATWGTRRRLSESEVRSIVDGSQVRHLSLAKRGRERGSSFLNRARGLIPGRSNSNLNKAREAQKVDDPNDEPATKHRESVGSTKSIQRIPSIGKPKSPPLTTGSALFAMTGHLTAIGRGASMKAEPERPKTPLQRFGKNRSRSDVGKAAAKSPGGLAELMTSIGGPPMPTLASPMQERDLSMTVEESARDIPAEDDEDEPIDEVGIKMDLSARADNIIPTFEGFKTHVRQLNPRLEPYLIDRIGQEQLRRYKKLVESKIKHMRAVRVNGQCSSGPFCFDLGGDASLLEPRVSAKDPEAPGSQFQITNPEDAEIDESTFTEGAVTPALFPPGIPLPPVKRLPAEFECSLCFKVKKFHKPSDWTKHVHEDIQPFSCTFAHCTEPKSFKRKADWVRHENERHRRLEYWKCDVQDCNHTCYRKDNFVQHLVREHKKMEPKVKSRGSGSSKARPPAGNAWQMDPREHEENEVWRLVEACRHETSHKPRDEPCKFCGNICNSWKMLSVHMGKHMEQIAMPILDLVRTREVSPDTIVSPIEQNYQQQHSVAPLSMPTAQGMKSTSLSPYTVSATSAYQGSSAGQSPITMQNHQPIGHLQDEQGFYSSFETPNLGYGGIMYACDFSGVQNISPGTAYLHSTEMPGQQPYLSLEAQLETGYRPQAVRSPVHQVPQGIPRSQPMGVPYTAIQSSPPNEAFYNTSQAMYSNNTPNAAYLRQYASPSQSDPPPGLAGDVSGPGHQLGMPSQPINNNYSYDPSNMRNGGLNYPY